jgi:hypothetical protein
MVETAQVIADALLAVTRVDGCQHLSLAAMPQFGPVADASAQVFHGAVISLRVVEF